MSKYSSYKSRAKRKGLEFKLSKQEFERITKKPCYYCGEKNNNGIDRYINQQGYTMLNSVSSCWTCNRAKSNMNIIEWEDYLAKFKGETVYTPSDNSIRMFLFGEVD